MRSFLVALVLLLGPWKAPQALGCGWAEFFARPQLHFTVKERQELVAQSGQSVAELEAWIFANRSTRKMIPSLISKILETTTDYRQRAAMWESAMVYYRIFNPQFVSWAIKGDQGAFAYMGHLGELLVFRRDGQVWRARHWLGDSEVLREDSLPFLLETRLLLAAPDSSPQ
jgi:hypothetical protein